MLKMSLGHLDQKIRTYSKKKEKDEDVLKQHRSQLKELQMAKATIL